MRLIDADKLNARLSRNGTPYFTVCDIGNAPTVDAVVVIRCKDCKNFHQNEENDWYCSHRDGLSDPMPNDFCSYGEQEKTNEKS